MKKSWLAVRSAFLWILSGLHFFIVAPLLVFLGIFLDPHKHDWLQRTFCRRIVFLSGASLEVRRAPGFDPSRTSFFVSNHVNVFDPFMLYCAIPQFVRGWELESHFKIPAYGWLMKRFGNVPVPDIRRPSDLKRMWRLTKDAVEDFVSGAVPANRKKMAIALIVSFARKLHRMALAGGCDDVNAQSLFAQPRKGRAGELCGTAATGGGVHDGEKAIHLYLGQTGTANSCSTQYFSMHFHKGRIAEALPRLARRSARTFLLIFKEAVRGKSSSRTTTPWIRL